MRKQKKEIAPLSFSNPNTAWVIEEFEKLLNEWSEWNDYAQELPNMKDNADFNPNTCAESIKDGRSNLNKHEILREKTLVFLRNNFIGYEFILAKWDSHPHESITCRLCNRVPHWIQKLEMLKASLSYARVPDGFWKEKGKKLAEVMLNSPEKAAEIAASWLKNPFSGG
jgi:hypothetical protein